jgi:Ca2+-transporting ATPase
LPEQFHALVVHARLASTPEPFDPMERAFHSFASATVGASEPSGSERKLARSYGLRPELLAMTQVWQANDGTAVVAAKGAPEAIADLCRLSTVERSRLRYSVDEMAGEGLRVLGVAGASHVDDDWPDSQRGFDFAYLGLVGLADPLRAGVPDAVRECRTAGIRVVMITGDYPATARAIARQAGLDASNVLTGDAMTQLGDAELTRSARAINVFARVMPEQKLRLVQALKAAGEIVAMTGDGVNDAPSLKAAHIGVAMGGRGTDVAREASSIVLLNDDFGSIVRAIRLGRRIYDNLRKAMGFIFAVHVPIAGLALLPLLLGLPIIFTPIHVAFLELIIDPVCSLAFEAETDEADVMKRSPRPPNEPLFSWSLIGWSVLQGALAFVVTGAILLWASWRGMPDDEVRALTFFSLVTSIIGLILVNRSFSTSLITAFRRPNPTLAGIVLGVILILSLSLRWTPARELFRFGPLHTDDLGLTLSAGLGVLVVLETLKPLWRAQLRP